MNNPPTRNSSRGLNARQRALQRHAAGGSLRRAIRLAVFAQFRFTHCGGTGEALWSETHQVWLGKKTFLHWSMFDPEIDIPSAVATASDAPQDAEELCQAVQTELAAFWSRELTVLPRRDSPSWPPLP